VIFQYNDLVVTRKVEDTYDFENALEVYKSFNWVKRQSTWGKYPLGCHAVTTAQTVCVNMCS
jgi:hypothetical protein